VQTALTTQLSPGQTLSFGLNYLEDSSYQQPTVRPEFFDAAIARTSAFLIDDISFGPELKANVGLRYTYSTQFGQVLTPAVGLRYNPDRIFSIRANWSQVYTAPAITNLFTRSAGFLSNANLRPETGITYDLGVDITPAPNLGIRLTYFNTSLDGVIGTRVLRNPNATTPGDPTFGFLFLNQFDNINSRRASGIELATDWQPSDQWRLRLSWTNSDTRAYGLVDDPSQPTFPYFYGYQDPNIAFNTVVLSATYANRGFQTSLLARYESGKRRPNALDFTPAFATVDLNFEVPITTNLTLTGSVLNLTDAQYELLPGAPAPGTTFRLGGRVTVGG
jgi:outer membrane receptor protein involved in Fe transport